MHLRELARSGKTSEKKFSEISEFSTSPLLVHNLHFNTIARQRPRSIALEIPGLHEILWSIQIKNKECFEDC